jgi:catechol 2,3-dioxygenase-like lactoylglutathione lyase family enzyme
MTSRLTEIIFDCRDLDRMVEFWSSALGYERHNTGEGWASIAAPGGEPSNDDVRNGAVPPLLAFVLVPEGKAAKNRVHVDVTPIDEEQDDEVGRLLALGASRADIGQRDTPWVVLNDPEGNEFCVMPRLT